MIRFLLVAHACPRIPLPDPMEWAIGALLVLLCEVSDG